MSDSKGMVTMALECYDALKDEVRREQKAAAQEAENADAIKFLLASRADDPFPGWNSDISKRMEWHKRGDGRVQELIDAGKKLKKDYEVEDLKIRQP